MVEMKVIITINIEYETEREARIVYSALEPDNTTFVDSRIRGKSVEFKIESESLGTALNTADDLVFSEMVFESTEKVVE